MVFLETNPKLLIFLHWFWFNKDNNKESIQQLSQWLWIDSFSFNGLFDSQRERGWYSWFWIDKITKKSIFDDQFYKSIDYINFTINNELRKRNLERKDIILCWRSQWAFMSIYLWLTHSKKCHSVISLCWFTREWIDINIINKPNIIWLEAKNDTVLSFERKDSYKKLQNEWIKIDYILDEESDHDSISQEAIKSILNIFIKLKQVK
jgi:predicted esterase